MENKFEREEEIVKKITSRFPSVSVIVQRERRIWAQVKREDFIACLTFLRDELKFGSLCTVTGLDLGEEFQLIYHLAGEGGVVLSLQENAPKSDPVFNTATELFKGGVLFELEARNLLGLTIRGIPDDIKYPLPDHWPEGDYPLRKDWNPPANSKEE